MKCQLPDEGESECRDGTVDPVKDLLVLPPPMRSLPRLELGADECRQALVEEVI